MSENKKEQKHKVRTKEELLADLKNNSQFKEKMAFTRGVFYPALVDASKSIEDTLSFLGSINTVLMETFLEFMKEKKFSEMDLISKLDHKDSKFEEIKKLLELFNDKTVFDAKDILEGMRREIQLWVNESLKVKSLAELPKRWIDEL